LVDDNTFRLVADCPTPWPCFVIAATDESIQNDSESLNTMLEVLNKETENFKIQKNIDILLSERYQQKLEDIRKWLDLTRWSQEQISDNDLEEVQQQLLTLDLISEKVDNSRLVSNL
ncbi:MAG TPA: hypothetical protein VJ973_09660, partial [Christiangramia sp.]|nr:hypothetical protein [Christiangramia sp.]